MVLSFTRLTSVIKFAGQPLTLGPSDPETVLSGTLPAVPAAAAAAAAFAALQPTCCRQVMMSTMVVTSVSDRDVTNSMTESVMLLVSCDSILLKDEM